ncbi:GGDEF domain-containing protein, partial [Nostoc sp. CHAB 5836]|nr:GGDEF domain-containing protein [Nostoc sp. CHAB 5836]
NVAALRFELRQHKQEVRSLKHSTEQLQRLSMEDALTAPLANRRGLERRLGQALAQPAREPLFVAVVDVDRFKSVNDRYSHQVGDQVLRVLAELFQQSLRGQDLAARWGGDEFVLAFWAPDDEQAAAVGERLKRAVAAYPWGMLATGLCVSISLGLTRSRGDDSLDSLLLRSDLGMYAEKRQQPA